MGNPSRTATAASLLIQIRSFGRLQNGQSDVVRVGISETLSRPNAGLYRADVQFLIGSSVSDKLYKLARARRQG